MVTHDSSLPEKALIAALPWKGDVPNQHTTHYAKVGISLCLSDGLSALNLVIPVNREMTVYS